MYKKWIKKRGTPENMLYVGDNKKQDVDVPKSLGIRTCFLGKYEQADIQMANILELEERLSQ
jgi:FMN phosphatase YigB (HAD superfamily)